jgi:hypothetical protein
MSEALRKGNLEGPPQRPASGCVQCLCPTTGGRASWRAAARSWPGGQSRSLIKQDRLWHAGSGTLHHTAGVDRGSQQSITRSPISHKRRFTHVLSVPLPADRVGD